MAGRDKREIERVKVEPGQLWEARFPSSRPKAVIVSVVALVQKYHNRVIGEYALVEVHRPADALGNRQTHIRIDRLRKDYELAS